MVPSTQIETQETEIAVNNIIAKTFSLIGESEQHNMITEAEIIKATNDLN